MNRAARRRLARARRNNPPPPDLATMTDSDLFMWQFETFGLRALLGDSNKEAEATQRADDEPPAPSPRPEREPAIVAPAPRVEAKAMPPAEPLPPPSPRHAGEPDPAFVPPQNQYWEEKCRFRFRGLDEPYDDEPLEEDEGDW